MLNKILKGIIVILFATVIALATHLFTMTHLSIETDADGDSAFITCAGIEWFYGINGSPIG